MGVLQKNSVEALPHSKAFLQAHYPEKAWKCHDEYDIPHTPLSVGQLAEVLDKAASVTMTTGGVKAARMRANLTARAACLDDWERRLKQREKLLVESEDALENIATLHTRRSGIVIRSLRMAWGRESAAWFHHLAGLTLLALVVACFLTIAVHWQVRNWQCNQWQGMACWGVMGYTVIAGMSYITRTWIEERATDSKETGAFIFACLLPFVHFLTCLSAALWAVGISSMCHAN